jgi:coproporphyrinogen III oxidase
VDFEQFEQYLLGLQDRLLTSAEAMDGSGKKFLRDRWQRGSEHAGVGCWAAGLLGCSAAARGDVHCSI